MCVFACVSVRVRELNDNVSYRKMHMNLSHKHPYLLSTHQHVKRATTHSCKVLLSFLELSINSLSTESAEVFFVLRRKERKPTDPADSEPHNEQSVAL